jgi:hypothetical protein
MLAQSNQMTKDMVTTLLKQFVNWLNFQCICIRQDFWNL